MLKNIIKFIFFSAYSLFLIIILDVTYGTFFEKLLPLRNSVYLQLYGDSIHQRSNIENLFYELRSNSKLTNYTETRDKGIFFGGSPCRDVAINSFGMRNKEIKLIKDSFRILILGDSVTFALEIPLNERFTEVAEKILNKNVRKCEILNAGVCGYNTIQEFIALKEKYLKLKPDLVIFAYCTNDLEEVAIQFLPDEFPQKVVSKKLKDQYYVNINNIEYLSLVLPNQFFLTNDLNQRLILNSSIYRFLSITRFKKRKNIRRDSDLQYYLTGFDINDTLQNTNKLASANGNGFLVRFLILPTPSILQWNKKEVIAYLEKNNIIFWDFDAMIKRRFKRNVNFWVGPSAVHLNSHGHYIVGKLLAQEINQLIK